MSDEEHRDRDDRRDEHREAQNRQPGMATAQIETDDPAVVEASRRPRAEAADLDAAGTTVETSDLPTTPPIIIAPPSAVVVQHAARPQGRRRDDDRDRDRDRHESKSAGTNWTGLMAAAAIGLVCGLLGAWGYSAFFGSDKKDDQSQASNQGNNQSGGSQSGGSGSQSGSGSGESGSDADSGSEIPGFTTANDAETLSKQIRNLAQRIDRMNDRLDNLDRPDNAVPPNLHTLQVKVRELARDVDEVASLPSDLEMQKESLQDLEQTVRRLRDEVRSAHPPIGSAGDDMSDLAPPVILREAPTDPSTNPGAPAVIDLQTMTDAALERGLALFRRGEYLEARDVFRKVVESKPEDARAWYLEALADGLATGSWTGRPERLVGEGLARERAGNPPTPVIDATLEVVSKDQGRAWLEARRLRLPGR